MRAETLDLGKRIMILAVLLSVVAFGGASPLGATANQCRATCESRFNTCWRICVKIDPRVQTNCDANCQDAYEACLRGCK